MIFVDMMFGCIPNAKWKHEEACHMFGYDVEELCTFAESIGLKRAWLQNNGRQTAHFDLTRNKRALAVARGAEEVSLMELPALLNRLRDNNRAPKQMELEV